MRRNKMERGVKKELIFQSHVQNSLGRSRRARRQQTHSPSLRKGDVSTLLSRSCAGSTGSYFNALWS